MDKKKAREDEIIESFLLFLSLWYIQNKRSSLPWRMERCLNPYTILVSEVMLQQTQVSRVVRYFTDWVEKYPDTKSLANAKLSDVLLSWQGLGYNNRAIRLQKTAEIILKSFNGQFPENLCELQKLPGIGQYTASAIFAFVHNKKVIVVETNIRRVIIYHFFKENISVSDQEISVVLERTLKVLEFFGFDSRNFYWAMMDYGSYLKSSLGYNPNRQSKKYTKQSNFIGSFREKRSKILAFVLKNPRQIQLDEIYEVFIGWSPDAVDTVVQALYKDGLIAISDRGIYSA